MTKEHIKTTKGIFKVNVSENRQIGSSFYSLTLVFTDAGSDSFSKARPGQFAELDVSNVSLPDKLKIEANLLEKSKRSILLRRPFSFCDITSENGTTSVEILYCVVGPASLRMTTLKKGDSLSVIGPLGNGFWIPDGKKTALLVAGGMGAPPLRHLAKILKSQHSEIEAIGIVGAKTVLEFPFDHFHSLHAQQTDAELFSFETDGIDWHVTTDDGSVGSKGFVTEYLDKWLEKNQKNKQEIIIYSCGPEPMLKAVSKIANKQNIDCQVSLERTMGCGIGVCQSCAVECKSSESKETVYKLCCKDGPVFDSKEVVFSQ